MKHKNNNKNLFIRKAFFIFRMVVFVAAVFASTILTTQVALAGNNCASATVIPSLPYNATGLTTCGTVDNYTSLDACASIYMGGEDFVFKYTPAANQTVDITLTNTLTYTGVFVTQGCPNAGGSVCTAQATSFAGNPFLCGVALTAGVTYYIIVDTWPAPPCTPFDINIKVNAAPVSCNLNYSITSIPYVADSYVAGTSISLGDDAFSNTYIPIGFTFCFDGNQYNRLLISSNGYVIFDPVGCNSNLPGGTNAAPGGGSQWTIGAAIPNTTDAPRNAVLGPWHDTDPAVGGTIRYQTIGVTPNRRFVVSFVDLPMYLNPTCDQNAALNFRGQIKLYETTNNVEIHIFNKQFCSAWNSGAAILGLHNFNGTIARVPAGGYNYPTNWSASSLAWRFATPCTCTTVVLPVELIEFNAKFNSANKRVDLNWETASEVDNDYFTVEKSNDGFTFAEVAKVKGSGNTSIAHNYSATDSSPYHGTSYYRLKQTDFDGSLKYSEIKTINIDDDSNTFSIVPNPAKTNFDVLFNSSSEGKITLMIFNSQGKKVLSKSIESNIGFNQKTIDASRLENGVYHVRLLSDQKVMTTKLIIE